MTTPVAQVVKVNWKLVFPWLALFRALGLALHVRQVLVGVVAALLIALGEKLIGGIAFPTNSPAIALHPSLVSWVWLPWVDLLFPLAPPWLFGTAGFAGRPRAESWFLFQSVLRFVWVLVVGGLAGGILVRRAGMEFAREESVGALATVRFVLRRAIDYLSAPALPLAVVGTLGGLLWLAGLLAHVIPGGDYLLSAVWGLVLIAGILMAVLLIAVVLGWPMMIAAVSLNGGDGFDSLSRGFGFVLDRWRYFAWCIAIMTVYGLVSQLLVLSVLHCGEFLAGASLGWHTQNWKRGDLPQIVPAAVWPFVFGILFRGFAYSFFWSSMAIIYLVLRQSLDNAELHDVYVEGSPQDADALQGLINPSPPESPLPTLLPIINQP